jgi:hypothetical protein
MRGVSIFGGRLQAFTGGSAFFSRLRAVHFDAAPHTRGATQHCLRARGTAPCLGHPDPLYKTKEAFVSASTHEEHGFARRTRCYSRGTSLGALWQYSTGLDIAYVRLCAATMSGAWISQSY